MKENLKVEMQAYSDDRLVNMIRQQNFFGTESVEIAKSIVIERGVFSIEEIFEIEKEVVQKVAARRAAPYTPKGLEPSLTIGTALFILFILVRWAIRIITY